MRPRSSIAGVIVLIVLCLLAGMIQAQEEPVWKPGQSRPPALDYEFIDSYLDYRIYDLPPEVVYVQRFGRWAQGGQTGLLRVVVAEPSTDSVRRHLLYIQWVCDCAEGVVAMRPVSELNRREPMIYTPPTFDRLGIQNVVTIVGRGVESRRDREFRLIIRERGEVEVQEP